METTETFALREETKQRDLFIHIDLGDRYQVMLLFRANYLLRGKQSSCSMCDSCDPLPRGASMSDAVPKPAGTVLALPGLIPSRQSCPSSQPALVSLGTAQNNIYLAV